MCKKVELLLSLLRSIFINLKCLPFTQAIKIPMLFHYKTQIVGSFGKGTFELHGNVRSRMVQFGIGMGSFNLGGASKTFLKIEKGGKVIFHGSCNIARGGQLIVNKDAKIVFGKNCSFNANALINSGSVISFGDDFLGGWNVTIIDGDGHPINDLHSKSRLNPYKPIKFGNHCWLAAHSSVLKGVVLNDNTIVPYGSVITKSCDVPFVIFGSQPNKVLKNNVYRNE